MYLTPVSTELSYESVITSAASHVIPHCNELSLFLMECLHETFSRRVNVGFDRFFSEIMW